MPRTRFPRIRFTISALMALVAGIAMLTALLLPLVRLGKPSCLTPAQTAVWLLKSPSTASCTNCHATPNASPSVSAALAITTGPEQCPRIPATTASTSCVNCHMTPATRSNTLPEN
jgi:hypothetical protein